MKKIWMEVTSDKYELPVAIADSAAELAKMCGVKSSTVKTSVCHYNKHRLKKCKWRCVHIDDD